VLSEYEAPDSAATPEESVETREQLEALKDAIALLPRKMRDVFVMREYAQLGYEEIAAALGLRPGTVMSRLSRARGKVNERMRRFNDG
jgi:RNA polymerase sigma-70 factor (ECF subfamily)